MLTVLLVGLIFVSYAAKSQPRPANFGYIEKGDSMEFIFGQQKTITIGNQVIVLKDRFSEIMVVNVAGDFNFWNPRDVEFIAVMGNDKIFRLTIAKNKIGRKGESRQFKFVINQTHWVEPPKDAPNQITGKDRNTNLIINL
ncbi:MAG TPA: hypothetical protein VGH64_13330 [Puia sp.]|jgi:hypothetical protein